MAHDIMHRHVWYPDNNNNINNNNNKAKTLLHRPDIIGTLSCTYNRAGLVWCLQGLLHGLFVSWLCCSIKNLPLFGRFLAECIVRHNCGRQRLVYCRQHKFILQEATVVPEWQATQQRSHCDLVHGEGAPKGSWPGPCHGTSCSLVPW